MLDLGVELLKLLVQPEIGMQWADVIELTIRLHNQEHHLLRGPINRDGSVREMGPSLTEIVPKDVIRKLRPVQILTCKFTIIPIS